MRRCTCSTDFVMEAFSRTERSSFSPFLTRPPKLFSTSWTSIKDSLSTRIWARLLFSCSMKRSMINLTFLPRPFTLGSFTTIRSMNSTNWGDKQRVKFRAFLLFSTFGRPGFFTIGFAASLGPRYFSRRSF